MCGARCSARRNLGSMAVSVCWCPAACALSTQCTHTHVCCLPACCVGGIESPVTLTPPSDCPWQAHTGRRQPARAHPRCCCCALHPLLAEAKLTPATTSIASSATVATTTATIATTPASVVTTTTCRQATETTQGTAHMDARSHLWTARPGPQQRSTTLEGYVYKYGHHSSQHTQHTWQQRPKTVHGHSTHSKDTPGLAFWPPAPTHHVLHGMTCLLVGLAAAAISR